MADRVTDISSPTGSREPSAEGGGSIESPAGLAISVEDWVRTPRSVQVVVVMLWQRVQALEAEVQSLRAEAAELRERLGQTSRNSSKPPLPILRVRLLVRGSLGRDVRVGGSNRSVGT
ncbi:MAG: hypothetical protein AUJ92_12745 [Armatimonadetes bacterium CG2_30_59_28]|nr:MAG: hypothetical protein AUJ92_12745 [Armatimonadetes bacterium CG2_30_59_28]PIU60918.1 MAG: hypothetical protein COS85_22200 [Armatimonadetes bacterium CG07_land_8_20_14_0_80_59_28]PIX44017.1 MAG: hypothetical protein COZ56_05720 [Armatimonadetes bacterium CG_4_8_14_3_um_filter_58_9]PJB70980.1 MAG: hypothetical protein CO095_08580 [Armatimonadetes bacterium CG_4_9_14_3_um_filter_58_7]